MVKKNAALLFGLFFTAGACADSATNPSITSPVAERRPSVTAVPADVLTPFGSDVSVSRVQQFGIAQAATGGHASGRFDLASPFLGIESEQYSFVALSTGVFPSAKGEMSGKIARTTSFQNIHAAVDCLAISGNEAWISGPLKRLVLNGVPQPTEGRYVVWRVLDNGEGAGSPPDLASVLFVGFPQACLVLFGAQLPMTPDANIQVSQR